MTHPSQMASIKKRCALQRSFQSIFPSPPPPPALHRSPPPLLPSLFPLLFSEAALPRRACRRGSTCIRATVSVCDGCMRAWVMGERMCGRPGDKFKATGLAAGLQIYAFQRCHENQHRLVPGTSLTRTLPTRTLPTCTLPTRTLPTRSPPTLKRACVHTPNAHWEAAIQATL